MIKLHVDRNENVSESNLHVVRSHINFWPDPLAHIRSRNLIGARDYIVYIRVSQRQIGNYSAIFCSM